jgi:hypothetical protein
MVKYVDIVFRYWIRFLVLALLLPAAFTAASLTVGKVHQASAAMWVESPAYFGSAAAATGWNPYVTPAQNQADLLQQLLQTRDFQDAVGNQLGASGLLTETQRVVTVRSLATQIKVAAPGSHLVTINYTCQVASVCLAVLSDTLDVFRLQVAQLQQQDARSAASYLGSQLQTAQSTAAASDAALRQYLHAHPAVSVAAASSIPELALLVDQRDRDQSAVTSLQQELSQAQLTALGAAGAVSTISTVRDAPQLGRDSISLGSIQRALLLWLACFTAAAIYLLILAAADRTARDPRELERHIELPIVGTIPRLRHMKELL